MYVDVQYFFIIFGDDCRFILEKSQFHALTHCEVQIEKERKGSFQVVTSPSRQIFFMCCQH